MRSISARRLNDGKEKPQSHEVEVEAEVYTSGGVAGLMNFRAWGSDEDEALAEAKILAREMVAALTDFLDGKVPFG